MNHYVITVARGFGSGGKAISSALGDRLGIPCYEKQILEFASQQSGIDEKRFARVDERLRFNNLSDFLRRHPLNKQVTPVEDEFHGNDALFEIQSQVIRQLAETQSCIIIGKCADFILKDADNVVSLYIEAPRPACRKSIMEKLHVSQRRADDLITRTDRYRAKYYQHYTGGNYWTNPVNYDLTLNSDRIGRKKCVDVIYEYLKIRFGEDFEEKYRD